MRGGRNERAVWWIGLAVLALAPAGVGQDTARLKPDPPAMFVTTLDGRNPFWPIGFTPQAREPVRKEELRTRIDRFPPGTFDISSILVGDPPIAVINGGEYVPGDIIPVSVNGREVTVRLMAVEDGYIRVRHEDKTHTIRRRY